MINILQYIINGVSVGSLYALVAVGYSMVFGVLKFVNFAHGDFYMLGAYLVMSLGLLNAPLGVAVLGGLILCGLVAVGVNHFIYLKIGHHHRLILLIAAVAVSLFLENFIQVIFTSEVREFSFSVSDDVIFMGDQIVVRVIDLWVTFFAFLSAGVTGAFVRFTRMGMGIRAIASNPVAAQIMGVPMDRLISLTFFIGAVLATLAGTLQGMILNQVDPLMGISIGLKAFSAAVLGGVGSILGAVVGGFSLGILESVLIGMGYSAWKDALAFVLLIFFLFVRPQGFFGQKERVKV